MKKKKNDIFNKEYDNLKNSINNHSNKVPLYNIFFNDSCDSRTDSFYDMKIYNVKNHDNNKYLFKNNINYNDNVKIIACDKIVLLPTIKQKKELSLMIDGYRLIYNQTIKFIKNRKYKNDLSNKNQISDKKIINKNVKMKESEKISLSIINDIVNDICKKDDRKEKINKLKEDNNNDIILDPKIIKTYFLKEEIHRISKKYKTPVHTLNYAVQLACASYKSCLTNLKNGNIKKFNIRYIKKEKDSLIMDIEKTAINKRGFITSILGKEMKNKQNLEYNIESDCKLHYNRNTDLFTLLVPKIVKQCLIENNNNNYISIDPGLRTFMNCKTNNKYIEIGNNLSITIKKLLNRLDEFNEIKNKRIKNKKEKYIREKIKNKVKDMHWKIINYLTSNYKNIIIGNWSTKDIIRKNDSVLTKINKRIAQNISFYRFLERLKYKSIVKKTNLIIENEHYTSKMCTRCSNVKEDLGGNKIYKCNICNNEINRDYNGSRNIFLKSILKVE
jgi:transposase